MNPNRFDRLSHFLAKPRMTRRNTLVAAIGGMAAFGLGSRAREVAAQDATPAASSEVGASNPAFLFVQLAERGTWTPNPDDEGTYLLTLAGTEEQTLFYVDRVAGAVPTGQFLDALASSRAEPLNATVVVHTPEGERDVLVVELFDPVFTWTFGEDGEELLIY